jgi:hypothetical protein
MASLRGADHIVSRQGPPDPLQLELTHWLDLHGVLDLHQHSRTAEDLSGLRLITQPRGDVGRSADSGVIETPLEADCAERGKAVRYADAEANVAPEPTPPIGKFKFREAEAGRDLSARSAKFSSRSARNTLLWRPAIHWRPLDVTFKYRIAV